MEVLSSVEGGSGEFFVAVFCCMERRAQALRGLDNRAFLGSILCLLNIHRISPTVRDLSLGGSKADGKHHISYLLVIP